ncbi:hypothetical protein CB1_000932087 [Camelus ferus]|nr:hypothetical protein CB1_000932087 [Camelus ferus]
MWVGLYLCPLCWLPLHRGRMPPASSLGPWRFVGGCRAEVTSRIANVTQCRVTRVSWVLLRAPALPGCTGCPGQETLHLLQVSLLVACLWGTRFPLLLSPQPCAEEGVVGRSDHQGQAALLVRCVGRGLNVSPSPHPLSSCMSVWKHRFQVEGRKPTRVRFLCPSPVLSVQSKCKFTCTSGRCLYLGSLVCNQQNDCGDNSDEENCLLVTEHPPPGIFSYWVLSSGLTVRCWHDSGVGPRGTQWTWGPLLLLAFPAGSLRPQNPRWSWRQHAGHLHAPSALQQGGHQTQVPVGHVVVSELFCLQESPLTVGRWQGPTCKSSEVFILPTYTWK